MITDTPEGLKMSVYAGERTKRGLSDAIARVGKAFPGWSEEQASILKDRFADNEFTDKRMMDAVNHVIDNYDGYSKIPNIANFIRFDKQIKIYTYQQLCTAHDKGELVTSDYSPVDLGQSKPSFISTTDAERYNVKMWVVR
jgi:hypothetical protein